MKRWLTRGLRLSRHGPFRRVKRWVPKGSVEVVVQGVRRTLLLIKSPVQGIHVVRLTEGRDVHGRVLWERDWVQGDWEVKKRNVKAATGADSPAHLAPVESNLFSKIHALVAHCATTRYDDGDPRKPGWFTVKTMGSAWIVQVKEPDSCAQFTATGATLDEALQLADLLLSSDEAPWEPDPFLKRTSKK